MKMNEEQCSQARLARDARYDGLFFSAVSSTGVFCRSICPAKPAKEENVTYFHTIFAAERAGYRPCLRCRPESAPPPPICWTEQVTVRQAMAQIRNNFFGELNCGDLAKSFNLSSPALRRLFVVDIGMPPQVYAQTLRLYLIRKLLVETQLTIGQIAIATGFRSKRLNAAFSQRYNCTPSYLRTAKHRQASQTEASRNGLTKCQFNLAYRPPYDWPAMLAFFRQRAIPGVEAVSQTSYSRSFRIADSHGYLNIKHLPNKHAFQLTVYVNRVDSLMAVIEGARRLLDLDAHPLLFEQVLGKDPKIGPLVSRFPGTRLPGAWDPFEFAVRAVLGQQISVKAATTIAGRLVQQCGPATESKPPLEGISHYFPTVREVNSAALAGIGLTQKRLETLVGMIESIANGSLRLQADQNLEQFIKSICQLPGIGPWTANYVAMRGLSEPDAFPESDLGIIKALSGPDKKISHRKVAALAEAWRPWRAYAAIYLWRSLD